MEINILGYTIIFFVLIITYRIYKESDYFHLKCVISDIDGNKYCVRERNKLKLAADKLANVNIKLKKLVKHVGKKYPERENCKRLVSKFNPKKIYETLPTSEFTAYSQNKGEKLAFCLNTKKNGGKLIDLNTLTFVAIHELAHIASKSIGHNDEFWNNFKFLLEESEIIGIYKPEDYKNDPKNYCGMKITDNPYYDL
tara:strand:- start:2612 stop:3202 length:591 start_codon:yes stop_codon:yes gene_type:complete